MTFHPRIFPSRQILCTALTLWLAACASSATKQQSSLDRNPELWPKLQVAFSEESRREIDVRIDALLNQMSVAQKVGQITQAEAGNITPEQVKKYHIGSVLNGGGGFLNDDKYASVDDWVRAMDAYYLASIDTSEGGLAIPIIWGTDAVHGHNKIVGATVFPHNIGLGATRNGDLVRKISAITAIQVRATGMDWTFSPALSVVRNDRWGRTYEGFSEDPALVAELGKQSILGYQGDLSKGEAMGSDHIAATAKHFLADGGTDNGIDRGNNYDSEATLVAMHGAPYFGAIEAGVLSIMASHSSWNDVRMHGEKYLLTDILKNRLGFRGMVVGDWNSHGLVEGCSNIHCPASINAGVDMLMVPIDWEAFIKNTIMDVNDGTIPMARLNDAVRRILRVKFRSGLMDLVKPSLRPLANDASRLNAPEFKAVARQAVRESLVLLKNNQQTLPLRPNLNVLVTGKGADNLAQQAGGWTISWQSTDVTNKDLPDGTSIYSGIKQVVEGAGGHVELSENGQFTQKPDVAIVVYGEPPYAEWQGDIRHMGYQTGKHYDAKLLEKLKAQGIKTISVFLSGRPMWVNRAINASDAFIAAWLPGSEGAGIADVIFANEDGTTHYDFSGTLSYSWPKTLDQAEVNVGDPKYAPLFPFGYGLSYKNSRYLPILPTDENLDKIQGEADAQIFVGKAQDPWQVYVTYEQERVRYLSGIAKNNFLTLTEGDQDTQGDAIRAVWNGKAPAALQINNPNANRNFSEILKNAGAMVFDVRLLVPATAPVKVEMACRGEGCEKSVDLTDLVNTSPLNDWNELSVSLSCFANQGIRFEEITRAFALVTSGQLEIEIANIRLVPGMGDKAGVQCQTH